jgi:hypothetical protein
MFWGRVGALLGRAFGDSRIETVPHHKPPSPRLPTLAGNDESSMTRAVPPTAYSETVFTTAPALADKTSWFTSCLIHCSF